MSKTQIPTTFPHLFPPKAELSKGKDTPIEGDLRFGWIYKLRKHEFQDEMRKFVLSTNEALDHLRKVFSKFCWKEIKSFRSTQELSVLNIVLIFPASECKRRRPSRYLKDNPSTGNYNYPKPDFQAYLKAANIREIL